jgi:hypothetical protein
MSPTTDIRTGVQTAVVAVLNIPLLFIIFLGWDFWKVYAVVCLALGILSVLTWAVPAIQPLVFVPNVPASRIRARLAFAAIFSFTAAVVFYYVRT